MVSVGRRLGNIGIEAFGLCGGRGWSGRDVVHQVSEGEQKVYLLHIFNEEL